MTFPWQATRMEIGGAQVRVLDTGGEGIPVLLLHSAVGDADVWQHQLAALAEAGFRAVAFDRPGHGLSAGVWETGEAEATAALVDALDLPAYHLVGVAQGARIANELALLHRTRIRSLTIVASTAGVAVGPGGELPLVPASFLGMEEVWFRELGPSYRATDPDGVQRWLALVSRTQPAAKGQGGSGKAGPKPGRIDAAELGTLDVPVLIVGGDADPYAPPPLLRALREVYRTAELVVLAECGHSPQWERAAEFDAVLLEHLRG